ncbi:MAG: MarR family transcriptional regulator [Acidobacteriota bacterium]
MQAKTPLGQLLAEASKLDSSVHRGRETVARPAGLSVAQGRVLERVAETPMTVASLARRLALTRQSVQRVADLLVEEGVAELRSNPDHKRAKLLALTRSGEQRLEALQQAETAWLEELRHELVARTSEENIDPAIELLRLIREAIEAKSSQTED